MTSRHARAEGEPGLRHIVVVGGTHAEWAQLSDHQWTQRLAELGKVADHVGASWLAIRPFQPEAGSPEEPPGAAAADARPDGQEHRHPLAAERAEHAGGCRVVAESLADGRARLVAALATLQQSGTTISEASVAAVMNRPALVDPDLIVVLGPSHRLPPSIVWELAYSELVFLDVAWTDLQAAHLERAIDEFSTRHRRFGGLD